MSSKAFFISDTKIRPFIGQVDHDFFYHTKVFSVKYTVLAENVQPRTIDMLLERPFSRAIYITSQGHILYYHVRKWVKNSKTLNIGGENILFAKVNRHREWKIYGHKTVYFQSLFRIQIKDRIVYETGFGNFFQLLEIPTWNHCRTQMETDSSLGSPCSCEKVNFQGHFHR